MTEAPFDPLGYLDERERDYARPAVEPRGTDPISATLDAMDERRRRDAIARQPKPEQAARTSVLARETGAAPIMVEGREDAVEAGLRAERMTAVLGKYPALGNWADRNPRDAAAAADDHKSMGMLGRAFDILGHYGKAGVLDLARTAAATLDIASEAVDTITYPVDAAIATVANAAGIANVDPDALRERRRAMEKARRDALDARAEANRKAAETGNWWLDTTAAGVSSLPASMAALGVGLALRSPTAGANVLGGLIGADAFQEGRDKGLSLPGAITYSATQGAAEAVTERLPAAALLNDVLNKTPFGKTFLKQLATEIPGEQLASLVQDFSDWATLPENGDKTLGDFIRERPTRALETALQTFGGTTAQTAVAVAAERAVRAAGNMAERVEQAREARRQAAFMDQVAKAAEASSLRGRDPDAHAKMLTEAANEYGVESVYVPGEAVVAYMQSDRYDPDSDMLSSYAGEAEEAAAAGGDVVLPVGLVLGRLPGTPAWEALRDDIRLSAGGQSRREAEEAEKSLESDMAAMSDQIAQQDKAEAARKGVQDRLTEGLTAKFAGGGLTDPSARDVATLLGQRASTRASRLGQELRGDEYDDLEVRKVLPEGVVRALAGEGVTLQDIVAEMQKPAVAEAVADVATVAEPQEIAEADEEVAEAVDDTEVEAVVEQAADAVAVDQIAEDYAASLGQARGEFHDNFAKAIRDRDGWALKFITNGLNAKGKAAFSKATGVKLPRGNAASWKALREWAGISDEEDARAEADRKAEVKAEVDEFRAGLVKNAVRNIRVRDESGNIVPGDEWVDGLIERGFNQLVNAANRGVPRWFLSNGQAGYPVKKDLLAYARIRLAEQEPLAEEPQSETEPAPLEAAAAELGAFLEEQGIDPQGAVEEIVEAIDALGGIDAAAEALAEPEAAAAQSGDPARSVRDHLIGGGSFKTINDARKFLANLTGQKIAPGTEEAKRADEMIEQGVVMAARDIVAIGASPLDTFRSLVALYERQPKLGVRSSTSVEQQAYSTPVPLAYLASLRAGINDRTNVYEPSAGNGALLIAAADRNITANELNPDRAAALRSIYPGATVTQGDALADNLAGNQFDAVVANPPFGVVQDSGGDTMIFDLGEGMETREIDHAISLKALEKMKDGGRAVLIVGGINKTVTSREKRADAYNAKAKRLFYYRLYKEYNVTDHFTVAGELYARQGAGWPVDVIVLEGRGTSALPLPAVEPPRQYGDWGALESELGQSGVSGSVRGPGDGTDRGIGRPVRIDAGNRAGGGGERTDAGQPQPEVEPAQIRDAPAEREPAGAGRDRGQAPERVGRQEPGGTVRSGGRDRQRAQADAQRLDGEAPPSQVPYVPASAAQSLDTLVPFNMQTATDDALRLVEERRGSVDSYVAGQLGYTVEELPGYFSAEQIDALALALDNMERGAGFIIGDQTGIGKGRVVAGVIRYAMKSGRRPIFVTEKPTLYADMYRDMSDIGIPAMLGRDPEILMTNAAETVVLDDDGAKLKSSPAAQHNAKLNEAARGRVSFDVLFTTYNQMQTHQGKPTPRQAVLEAMAPGSILIFDESHNAGGQGPDPRKKSKKKDGDGAPEPDALNRAEFARMLAGRAHGVFFSSATYAKRPEVMDLYASTDIKLAVADPTRLGESIGRGGVPLQQVVASALAEAGQYLRRERSFEGVEYRTPRVAVDRETYAKAVRVIGAIREFEDNFVTDAIKEMSQELRREAKAISSDGSTGGAGADSTNFTSIMHNVVEQMLLSLKVEEAANRAIAAIEAGQKPVITLANTMGAFIEQYAKDNNLKAGDEIPLDFGAMMGRYLSRTRQYTVTPPGAKKGEKEQRYLSDDELGPAGRAAYREVEELIAATEFGDMPLSPIDHIRQKIIDAGYTVGEITGRSVGLDYSGAVPTLKIRSSQETSIAGKRKAISGFNNGDIDAMILNQSGSTGLSLHASEKYKDQRPRVMILAQAERNVDTHMQMLGRIHRTGQVVLPAYDQLVADVPAEMRPAAVLAKKMASLNANTTGARDSAMTGDDVPDFMNKFGDEIAARILEDDETLAPRLGLAEKMDDEGLFPREDAARRVTGRITLLPLDEQEAFYAEFLEAYKALLEQAEAAGEAGLEAKTLDLDANVIDQKQIVAPTKPGTPFGEAVFVETLDVKRLGKPMQPEEVVSRIAGTLGIAAPGGEPDKARVALLDLGKDHTDKLTDDAMSEFYAYRALTLDGLSPKAADKARPKLDANEQAFRVLMRQLAPGEAVILESPDGGRIEGVVLSVDRKRGSKNPLALSKWQATVAINDAARTLTLPLSALETHGVGSGTGKFISRIGTFDGTPPLQAFAEAQRESRERRTMFTGNILAAYTEAGNRGQVVNFVGSDGSVRSGILMRRGYNHTKEVEKRPVAFRTPDQIIAWLQSGEPALAAFLSVQVNGSVVTVTAAAAKSDGGQYFLNRGVRDAIGGDFYKGSKGMVATAPAGRLPEIVDALQKAGAVFQAKTNLGKARKITAGEDAPRSFNQSYSDDARGRVIFDQNKRIIELFEASNLSTPLHELGHVWLGELRLDATLPDVPDQLKADWRTVLDWFAANGHPLGPDGQIPVGAHELWARGIERYLMEGKAPSSALQRLFETFRGWLTAIYRTVDRLKAPITPEIREVMDRLIATDEEIAAAAERQNLSALFKTAADAAMSGPEFQAYQALASEARHDAHAKLLDKAMAAVRRRYRKEWKDERDPLLAEAAEVIDELPLYRALRAMKDTPISQEWIVLEAGEEALARLPKRVPSIFRPGGADPSVVAEMSGFASGREMLDALVAAETEHRVEKDGGDKRTMRQRAIEAMADAEMERRHGDPFSDGSIEREALEAVHNDRQGDLIAAELRVLARSTGRRPTPYRLARDWARNRVRSGRINDEASPAAIQRYARSAAKAGRLAEQAMLKQDADEAFRQKQFQLLNNALVAEAKAAHDEVETAIKRLVRIAGKRTMPSIDQDYLERAHELLEAVDLRPRSQRLIDEKDRFEAWAARERAAGREVVTPPRLEFGQHWSRLPVEDLLALDETVRSIMHLGQVKQSMLDRKVRREFAEWQAEVLELLDATPGRKLTTGMEDHKRPGAALFANLMKMEVFALEMDDGAHGPMSRLLTDRATEAANHRDATRDRVLVPIAEAYQALDRTTRDRLAERIVVPEMLHRSPDPNDPRNGEPLAMTRWSALAMALNLGTESNLDKLARGYGISPEAAEAIVMRELGQPEWVFVQSVWQALETLWPDIAATEREMSGVEPERVEPREIVTPFGVVQGGYYPVVYDPAKSQRAEDDQTDEADDLFGSRSGVATATGHTKERTGYAAPILLSPEQVLFRHVEKVVTRNAYAPWVRDVLRAVKSPPIRAAIDRKFGHEFRQQIEPWLRQQVREGLGNDQSGAVEAFARHARINMSIVAMGLRWSTGVAQAIGLANSIGRIGPTAMRRGFQRMLANPKASADFVFARSPEMLRRNEHWNREVSDAFARMRQEHQGHGTIRQAMAGLHAKASTLAFWHIGMIDRWAVSLPTWLGAYDKALREGQNDSEAAAYADSMVRLSQGSGRAKDLSYWQSSQTSEFARFFTMFYTPFNVFLNAQWETGRAARRGDWRKAGMLAFWFLIATPLLEAFLAGDTPGDDDDEEGAWTRWLARNIGFYQAVGVPVLRDVATYAERKMIGEYATFSPGPIARMFSAAEGVGKDAWDATFGDGEASDKWLRHAIETPGYFLGLPTGQPAATAQFLYDVYRDEADPENAAQWYEGLTKGRIKESAE